MGWGWGRGLTKKDARMFLWWKYSLPWLGGGVGGWFTWLEKLLKIYRTVHFISFFKELYILKDKFLLFVNYSSIKEEHFTSLLKKVDMSEVREWKPAQCPCSNVSSAPAAAPNALPPGAVFMGTSRWIQEGRRKLYFLSISSILFGWEYLVSSREDSTKTNQTKKLLCLKKVI